MSPLYILSVWMIFPGLLSDAHSRLSAICLIYKAADLFLTFFLSFTSLRQANIFLSPFYIHTTKI